MPAIDSKIGKTQPPIINRPAKTPNYNKRIANRQAIMKAVEA